MRMSKFCESAFKNIKFIFVYVLCVPESHYWIFSEKLRNFIFIENLFIQIYCIGHLILHILPIYKCHPKEQSHWSSHFFSSNSEVLLCKRVSRRRKKLIVGRCKIWRVRSSKSFQRFLDWLSFMRRRVIVLCEIIVPCLRAYSR